MDGRIPALLKKPWTTCNYQQTAWFQPWYIISWCGLGFRITHMRGSLPRWCCEHQQAGCDLAAKFLLQHVDLDRGRGRRIQPINQSTDRPTNQATKQQTNQPIDQPTDRPTDRRTDRLTDRPTDRPIDQSTNRPSRQPSNQPTNK